MASRTSQSTRNGAADETDVSMEALSAQIEILKKDLAGLTDAMAELGRDRRDAAIAGVSDRAAHLRDESVARAREAAETARRFGVEAERRVEERPFTAMAVAAAVGAAVGYLTARK